MKNSRKIIALLIALMMVMAMSVTAFADGDTETLKNNGDFSVTITADSSESNTGTSGHSYKAYQVFKGDLVESSTATTGNTGAGLTLSNIEFGTGVNGEALISALNTASATTGNVLYGLFPAASVTDAKSLAKALESLTDDAATTQAVAEIVQDHLTSVASGTGSATGVTGLNAGYYFIQDEGTLSEQEAATRYILQVVHSVIIAQKASVPSIKKEVKDINDSSAATSGDWDTDADYDIGDAVPFKITGTLPSTFADYDTYTTYTIKDTLSNGLDAPTEEDIKIALNTEDGTDISSLFDIDVSGQVITISLKENTDLKTVTSPATFSASSEIIVTYSAVLNENANIGSTGNENTVYLEFSNNPNADGSGDNGKTPESTVIVFTYKVVANKTDGTNDLPGAGFTLYKKYKTADQIPDGKNAVTTATYNEGRSTYTFETGEWVWAEWKKIDATESGVTFSFEGVDDGDYVLVEHQTPAGYNSIEPVAFSVTAVHDDKALTSINGVTTTGTVELGTLEATASKDAGSLTTTVVNQSGSVLPSTGGIGTTIFYVLGSVMALGALVLLVTKRRVNVQ